MCNSDSSFPRQKRSSKIKLILNSSSLYAPDHVETDGKEKKVLLPPSYASMLLTICFFYSAFVVSEKVFYILFSTHLRDTHPLLESDINCQILARHIGTDAFASLLVGITGYLNRHLFDELWTGIWEVLGKRKYAYVEKSSNANDFHRRVYGYCPEGLLVLIFFTSYQLKNFVDTLKWNDGILFVIHHVVALIAACIGILPNIAQLYGIFFMGMSEISTGVLCILANFDDEFGVAGLGDAFPITKVVLGAIFVVLFVICRIILWPYFTYYFVKDCRKAIERNSPAIETTTNVLSIKCLVSTCMLLTFLQVLFLGQIVVETHKTISSLM